jgi:hypothetical protein
MTLADRCLIETQRTRTDLIRSYAQQGPLTLHVSLSWADLWVPRMAWLCVAGLVGYVAL